jgi:Ca2+-binding EF-hand superfamily protein
MSDSKSSMNNNAAAAPAPGPSASAARRSQVVGLTAEEEQEFREVFNLVDSDKGGTISKQELAQLMHTLSISASPVSLFSLLNS